MIESNPDHSTPVKVIRWHHQRARGFAPVLVVPVLVAPVPDDGVVDEGLGVSDGAGETDGAGSFKSGED